MVGNKRILTPLANLFPLNTSNFWQIIEYSKYLILNMPGDDLTWPKIYVASSTSFVPNTSLQAPTGTQWSLFIWILKIIINYR